MQKYVKNMKFPNILFGKWKNIFKRVVVLLQNYHFGISIVFKIVSKPAK
jgi:hypothetical protein